MRCMAFLLFFLPRAHFVKPPPHIVFILVDDLGWDDVSFHGSSQIPTPNIDALAADGIILNNYYAQPSCTPSRAALMTGLYPIRTGLHGMAVDVADPWGLPTNITILPEYLKELGYETHLVGKWALGYCTKKHTPTFRGFDSFYGYYNSEEDYYTHSIAYENSTGLDFWFNMEPLWSLNGTYSTTLYTERAKYIIRNRQKSKPLFLLMSHQAPHGAGDPDPFQAPQENVDKFPYIEERNRTVYAGMVDAMDQSIGSVFQALSEAGMLDNTVVVFSSDNGGAPWGLHASRSFNWPLRGVKGTLWEGGTRVAAFIWSPRLRRNRTVSHQLMHITDWLPTLYSVAGGNAAKLAKLDGHNMWHHLSNGFPSPRIEMLYNFDDSFMNAAALRFSRFKLVLDGTGFFNGRYRTPGGFRPHKDLNKLLSRSVVADVLKNLYKKTRLVFPRHWRERATLTCGWWQRRNFRPTDSVYLFDIVRDPCELDNLARILPQVVAFLKMRIDAFRAEALPLQWAPKDPAGFPEKLNGTWAPWMESP
ncbi:arylsulfatase B-like isoform X2 [Amblyomma americanum]